MVDSIPVVVLPETLKVGPDTETAADAPMPYVIQHIDQVENHSSSQNGDKGILRG